MGEFFSSFTLQGHRHPCMIILVLIYKCGDEELVEKTTATQLGKCHSAGNKSSPQRGVKKDSRGQ